MLTKFHLTYKQKFIALFPSKSKCCCPEDYFSGVSFAFFGKFLFRGGNFSVKVSQKPLKKGKRMSFFFTQKKKDEKEVCQRAVGSQRQALLTFRQTALAEVAARAVYRRFHSHTQRLWGQGRCADRAANAPTWGFCPTMYDERGWNLFFRTDSFYFKKTLIFYRNEPSPVSAHTAGRRRFAWCTPMHTSDCQICKFGAVIKTSKFFDFGCCQSHWKRTAWLEINSLKRENWQSPQRSAKRFSVSG